MTKRRKRRKIFIQVAFISCFAIIFVYVCFHFFLVIRTVMVDNGGLKHERHDSFLPVQTTYTPVAVGVRQFSSVSSSVAL